jgi:hypothetical protein
MPYLGDYLGHLLSEITIARMQADLEAVRVAELYASHPLLRNMPVPHFRLPDVDLDVPVVIKQVEEPRADESPRGGAAIADMRKSFDKVLAANVASRGVDLAPEQKRKLKAVLDARTAALSQPAETSVDVNRVADDLAAAATAALAEPRLLEAELKSAARLEFLKLRKPPARLSILATTQEIRDAGPAENVTRIRLKISEQAVEWTTVESDGQTRERLVPE